MRSTSASTSSTAFLGVRLTPEELDRLDRFQKSQECPTRSDAVRALVRAADRLGEERLELPVAIDLEIEELAADGYAGNKDAALAVVLHLGLAELTKTHGERLSGMRRNARELRDRKAARQGADREAQERLEP
ncbi:MAG: ribbon-helix-helix domain-containing protein [Thermoplasmata archaeon]|nr:ribbon-helix-helix domain-containing protein [Thermoplasmata archaeon]